MNDCDIIELERLIDTGTIQMLDGAGQAYLKEDQPFDVLLEGKETLIQAVFDLEFDSPSRIQVQAIATLCGSDPRDLRAQAPSGSGKTVAFLLSMLMHVDLNLKHTQAMALFNTRELTQQTAGVFEHLNMYYKATGGLLLGSGDRREESAVSSETQVLFATPRSVINAAKRKKIDLSKLRLLVVDEADEVMRKGSNHSDDMAYLLKGVVPKDCQKGFFSATYSKPSIDEIRRAMRPNAISLELRPAEQRVTTVTHWVVRCEDDADAIETLTKLYRVKMTGQAVIFVQMKDDAPELAGRLNAAGYRCEWFGSLLTHEQRAKQVKDFREGKFKVLITTDILSRGFDVPATFLVVNWTPPMRGRGTREGEHVHPAIYYHRAGRAGRFGRTGICFTFVRSDAELEGLRWACGRYGIDLKNISKDQLGDLPDEQVVADDGAEAPLPQVEAAQGDAADTAVQALAAPGETTEPGDAAQVDAAAADTNG
jgi:ATP-dependent RNA helicase DDX19/DBP5